MIWEKFKKILIMIGVLKSFKDDYNRFENDFYFSFKFWNILVMFLIFEYYLKIFLEWLNKIVKVRKYLYCFE